MKKYIAVKNNSKNITDIEVEMYYHLGGMNYFTYENEPRGYYIRVTPVEREKRDGYTMVSFGAFTGYKKLLLEVTRKSKKSEKKAEELSIDDEKMLINRVCDVHGLEVA